MKNSNLHPLVNKILYGNIHKAQVSWLKDEIKLDKELDDEQTIRIKIAAMVQAWFDGVMTDVMSTRYSVRRCRKDDTWYGPSHGTNDNVSATLCGKKIDKNFYITHNDFSGVIDCKKCLKILEGLNNEQT